MTRFGTLWGVGVGPGDPQLLTLKAVEILRCSTVIAYVVDDKGESYARQTALANFLDSVCELPLRFSMSPQREQRLTARAEAARLVLERLSAGQDVTFITEGDPMLYSTFQHLLSAMPPDVRVKICPGISSLTAAAAAARFPLAVEGQRMVIAAVTPETPSLLTGWLEQFEVVVLFKAHQHLKEINAVVKKAGALSRSVRVQRASLAGQSVVTNLAEWDDSAPPYFSILLIRSDKESRAQP